ncbi:MAG: addiction module protein [Kiritimatiellia bacterium]
MVSNELKSKVDQLSIEERASLASYLLHSLEAPDYDVSDAEVMQRVDELHTGMVQEMDHETLLKGLNLRNSE